MIQFIKLRQSIKYLFFLVILEMMVWCEQINPRSSQNTSDDYTGLHVCDNQPRNPERSFVFLTLGEFPKHRELQLIEKRN